MNIIVIGIENSNHYIEKSLKSRMELLGIFQRMNKQTLI